MCGAYVEKRFAEMFSILGARVPAVRSNSEKREWSESMQQLMDLRDKGTVGDVLDHLYRVQHPRLPEELEDLDRSLRNFDRKPENEEQPELTVLRNLRSVPYCEVIRLVRYLEGDTPFSTKHGVKGAEFENVLVIVGMGWNRYNFNQMLEWAADGGAMPQREMGRFRAGAEPVLRLLFTAQTAFSCPIHAGVIAPGVEYSRALVWQNVIALAWESVGDRSGFVGSSQCVGRVPPMQGRE